MGSWAYCHKCHLGIGPPTVAEAVAGAIVCGRCGRERELDRHDCEYYGIMTIHERLEEAEKKIAELTKLVDTFVDRR